MEKLGDHLFIHDFYHLFNIFYFRLNIQYYEAYILFKKKVRVILNTFDNEITILLVDLIK